jgi:hypothetical protein
VTTKLEALRKLHAELSALREMASGIDPIVEAAIQQAEVEAERILTDEFQLPPDCMSNQSATSH